MSNLILNINGSTAVLPSGFVLPFQAQSPLCSDGITGNSFSYPINLRADANAHIFKNIHHLNTPYTEQYTGIMEVCGQPLREGIIEVTCVTECDIQIVFKSREQDLCEALEGVQTNNVLGTIIFETPGSGDNFWCYELDPVAGVGYIIFIGPVEYISTGTTNITGALDLANQINADCPGLAFNTGGQLKINIMEAAMKGFDVTQSANNMTLTNPPDPAGADVQQDIISNIKQIQNGPANSPVAFPMLKWRAFYGTENPKFCNLINFCVDNTSLQNETYEKETPAPTPDDPDATTPNEWCWYHTYVPHVNLFHLTQQVVAKAGYKLLKQGFWAKPVRDQLILTNNCAIDQVVDASETGTEECINAMNPVLDLNEHVPEMSGKELLNKIRENFGLYLQLKGDCLVMACVSDTLAQPAKTLTSVCRFKSVPKLFRGFKLEYDDDYDGVRCPADQLQDYFNGPDYEVFTQPFSTYCMDNECEIDTNDKGENTPVQGTIRVPSVFQNGCSQETSIGQDRIECGLLINRGMQTAADGSTYPYASHDALDPSGEAAYEFTLNFEEENANGDQIGIGQYIQAAKMLNYRRTLSVKACLSIAQIVEILKFDHPWTIHTEGHGSMTGIIKSISFQVSEAIGLGEVSIEMVSLC